MRCKPTASYCSLLRTATFRAALTMGRNIIILQSLGFIAVVLLSSYLNVRLLWIHNSMHLLRESQTGAMDHLIFQTTDQWSNQKVVIYMTTHFPEHHVLFLPCWNDAIQRMQIFRCADLILYTSAEPTPDVGSNRSEEGNVTEFEEIDSDGFITVQTRKTKQAIKRSIESNKCKSVSRVILLKQSS
jgi:hypothetical protein